MDILDNTKNRYNNALTVVANELARKRTRWTINEQKLFYAFVSQVQNIDKDFWIDLRTKEILRLFEMDGHPYTRTQLEELLLRLMEHSKIEFRKEDLFSAGFLITNTKVDSKHLKIKFNEYYLPLIQHLEKQFTMFKLRNIGAFKSKHTLALYVDLKSRYNPLDLNPDGSYTYSYDLERLKDLLGIEKNDYVRKATKTRKAGFDFYNFNKRVLERAVKEINKDSSVSGMRIKCESIKDGREILGYRFSFILVDENGYAK